MRHRDEGTTCVQKKSIQPPRKDEQKNQTLSPAAHQNAARKKRRERVPCGHPSMKVRVNVDKQVSADGTFKRFAKENIRQTLQRLESQLTRVEAYLSDVNSAKPGALDKRCLWEARPARRKPLSVTQTASTREQALQGAGPRKWSVAGEKTAAKTARVYANKAAGASTKRPRR